MILTHVLFMDLKGNMVWQYVELKALDILCEIKHPDFTNHHIHYVLCLLH